MKTWQWFAVAFVLVCILAGSLFGYRLFSKRRDLAETLSWMDHTYNPHEGGPNFGRGYGHETHYLLNSKTNTQEITKDFEETFSYSSGCTIVLHHQTNPVGIYKEIYWETEDTLHLGDIDPDTIKINTYDFYKDVGGCDKPEMVTALDLSCTSAEVEFHLRNDSPKISETSVQTYANLTGAEHEQRGHSQTSKGWFIVDDATYAQRFAKALRHAVDLCGGQASKF